MQSTTASALNLFLYLPNKLWGGKKRKKKRKEHNNIQWASCQFTHWLQNPIPRAEAAFEKCEKWGREWAQIWLWLHLLPCLAWIFFFFLYTGWTKTAVEKIYLRCSHKYSCKYRETIHLNLNSGFTAPKPGWGWWHLQDEMLPLARAPAALHRACGITGPGLQCQGSLPAVHCQHIYK